MQLMLRSGTKVETIIILHIWKRQNTYSIRTCNNSQEDSLTLDLPTIEAENLPSETLKSKKMEKLYNTMESMRVFVHIFYEKLFKSLETHCFTPIKMPGKNYKLVILATLVVPFGSSEKTPREKIHSVSLHKFTCVTFVLQKRSIRC